MFGGLQIADDEARAGIRGVLRELKQISRLEARRQWITWRVAVEQRVHESLAMAHDALSTDALVYGAQARVTAERMLHNVSVHLQALRRQRDALKARALSQAHQGKCTSLGSRACRPMCPLVCAMQQRWRSCMLRPRPTARPLPVRRWA